MFRAVDQKVNTTFTINFWNAITEKVEQQSVLGSFGNVRYVFGIPKIYVYHNAISPAMSRAIKNVSREYNDVVKVCLYDKNFSGTKLRDIIYENINEPSDEAFIAKIEKFISSRMKIKVRFLSFAIAHAGGFGILEFIANKLKLTEPLPKFPSQPEEAVKPASVETALPQKDDTTLDDPEVIINDAPTSEPSETKRISQEITSVIFDRINEIKNDRDRYKGMYLQTLDKLNLLQERYDKIYSNDILQALDDNDEESSDFDDTSSLNWSDTMFHTDDSEKYIEKIKELDRAIQKRNLIISNKNQNIERLKGKMLSIEDQSVLQAELLTAKLQKVEATLQELLNLEELAKRVTPDGTTFDATLQEDNMNLINSNVKLMEENRRLREQLNNIASLMTCETKTVEPNDTFVYRDGHVCHSSGSCDHCNATVTLTNKTLDTNIF